ncbi:hypothetical protein [Bacillus wiedmannii]|uniref:Lipoprotein n=1 Tax=Bacillus wiedmannii TaxID=1890302 RepID=A0A2A8N003_9BACI|nr:hypothetical protein [Bacillus wiedmannii]PEI67579.1 hypothetical protein CN646_17970 [Bacillus wiedmannii]PEK59951.1 hypothetical protein CN595_16715 [Bacillus wiedmannii]PEL55824.1 hypothetical protein CN622_26270 [Bacillus wiedmannii]PEM44030.1 hypothetical protein CN618_29465 [Bacillus wiedmannii]PEO16467.1 hypothetical protein CN562_06015 [Bacillus wiedmannii]
MKYLKKKSGKLLLATGLAFSMAACGVTDNKEKTNAESSKQQNNNNSESSNSNNNSNSSNSNDNNNSNSNSNNSNGNNNNSNSNNSNGNNNNNSNSNNSNGNNNNNSNSNNSNGNNNVNNNTNTSNEWDTNSSNNNSNNNSNSNQQKPNQNQERSATSVTLEQHGIIVTVHKVEQADNIVRVKYTINNTTNQTIFSDAPGAKIEQNGKSTIPSDFKGNWDQRGYIAPHTSVDGTNLYSLSEITNEFDFKIRPSFEDTKNNPLVENFILRVKMY